MCGCARAYAEAGGEQTLYGRNQHMLERKALQIHMYVYKRVKKHSFDIAHITIVWMRSSLVADEICPSG